MEPLSLASQLSLYALLALTGALTLIVWGGQIWVFRGNAFPNPDGSKDDWHEQKIVYGMALADIVVACPVTFAAIILVFISPRWGIFLLALGSFWMVWANVATTATSLRFHTPRMTAAWVVAFPLGAVVGLACLIWIAVHFDTIFAA